MKLFADMTAPLPSIRTKVEIMKVIFLKKCVTFWKLERPDQIRETLNVMGRLNRSIEVSCP
jgi:hypothetical protein